MQQVFPLMETIRVFSSQTISPNVLEATRMDNLDMKIKIPGVALMEAWETPYRSSLLVQIITLSTSKPE